MTGFQIIDDGSARTLFATVRDHVWTWRTDQLPDLLALLGWTIAEELPGKAAIADTPWGIPDADVTIGYAGEAVADMLIGLTTRIGSQPDLQPQMQDAFASLAELAAQVLGAPSERSPGSEPTIRWRLESSTLTLQKASNSVIALWASSSYQDSVDAMATELT